MPPRDETDSGAGSTASHAALSFPESRPRVALWLERIVRPADALFNRVYTSPIG